MIRHCVFVRFRSDVPETERSAIYADLAALRQVVPGFLAISYGANVSPEGLHQGFKDGFTIDFVDDAARDAYLVHPDHKSAGGRLVAALDGGRDGLIVFDIVV
ncbi:Dabb family protein [Devosia chinhatensis]|uniref:Stress responsive protein n=1 Tax=Devosia chinhatensis TaxID=429727 RepID=A0A0F5FKA2_9HYPH|nr:Dabb family protein [Devosia chinhatensis]KKB09223.1 stress responsive protein [Devosia chinhatensis]